MSIVDAAARDISVNNVNWLQKFKDNLRKVQSRQKEFDEKAKEPPQPIMMKRPADSWYHARGQTPPRTEFASRDLPNTAEFVPVLVRNQVLKNSARCYIQ